MSIAAPALDAVHAKSLSEMHDVLVAANINPRTGLSTDYLNHFNEMVMLLDLLAMDSEVAEEILTWRPVDYRHHFEHSGFRAKSLALLGYELCPATTKRQLEVMVAEIDTVLIEAQRFVGEAPESEETFIVVQQSKDAVEDLIARASALINGHAIEEPVAVDDAQVAVDALFEG
ncbi:hypothetical protein [Flaviflagellibacter deserti]|uniref:Uncharacterized protein n=1 Tax=Flaviflagellibacter deserti TaxID=2267266 RepID=A0ABV9YWM8_9HYPH